MYFSVLFNSSERCTNYTSTCQNTYADCQARSGRFTLVFFSTAQKDVQITPLHAKIPLKIVKLGVVGLHQCSFQQLRKMCKLHLYMPKYL